LGRETEKVKDSSKILGKGPSKPNHLAHRSPKATREPLAGNGKQRDHARGLATRGPPSKIMAQSLQRGRKLREAKIQEPLVERRR
jgi:hypothetical protein